MRLHGIGLTKDLRPVQTRPRRLCGHHTPGLLLIAGLLAPVQADAQSQTAPAQGDEIIVTAQKREQNIQKIGVAVSAIGADGLAALGRQDLTALATQVPSLQVNQYSPTVTVFNIRGVSQNDFADAQEAPIAFYNDDVYVGALGAISGMSYDLERIEVLRGPQGTLFGRNATGGLVQILSAKPTRQFDAFLTTTVGSYGQLATEGAVSGPLSDRLRARLSFTTDDHGGYIKNRVGPDLGGRKFYAGRLQLAGDVGDAGEFNIKVQALRNDHETSAGAYSFAAAIPDAQGLGRFVAPNEDAFGTCAGCNVIGYKEPDNDPFTGSFNGPNDFSRTYWSATAHYTQDIGAVTLTSITDYQHLSKDYVEDSDMTPENAFTYRTHQRLYQLSQELRLSGKSSKFNWIAGLYGLKIHTENSYTADLSQSFGLSESFGGPLTTESVAVFGQVDYSPVEKITLIGGLRYSVDWKRIDYNHSENGVVDLVFNPGVTDLASKRFSDYSGKAEIDYKPNDDVLIYASVNRGTKSGGFGTPGFPPIDPTTIPFKSEILTSYEGGAKITLFNRTTHLNVSLFYYDYHNYQTFEVAGFSTIIKNADARIKGLEIELNSRPIRPLYFQFFASILDARVKDLEIPNGEIVDRDMPQAPRFSAGGLVRYEIPVGPGKASLQTNWKYDSHQYFTTFNAPVDREPHRIIGDVRLAYEWNRWKIAFFVNNVTNKAYRVANVDGSSFLGYTQQTYAPPRWFGGTITVNY